MANKSVAASSSEISKNELVKASKFCRKGYICVEISPYLARISKDGYSWVRIPTTINSEPAALDRKSVV